MLSDEQLIRAALTGAGFGDMTEAALIDALELIESGDEEVIAEVAGLRAVAEAAVKDEREVIDTLVDEKSAKLLSDDKTLGYWHGVRAASIAIQIAIRARGEKTS